MSHNEPKELTRVHWQKEGRPHSEVGKGGATNPGSAEVPRERAAPMETPDELPPSPREKARAGDLTPEEVAGLRRREP